MASQSLVVKATAFTEWNGPDFPAWIGYAPANHDYSDLHSLLALCVPFLSALTAPAEARSCKPLADLRYPRSFQQREGADAGSGQFDELGRRMAEAGRCWKARTGRVVDMQAYRTSLPRPSAALESTSQLTPSPLPLTSSAPDVPRDRAAVQRGGRRRGGSEERASGGVESASLYY